MGVTDRNDDQAKLNALNYANEAVLNFGHIMHGLASNNPFQQLEATKAVCELLSLVAIFSTPLERRSITTVLVKIYHLCYEGGVMNRIMSFLTLSSQPPLQFQALKAVRAKDRLPLFDCACMLLMYVLLMCCCAADSVHARAAHRLDASHTRFAPRQDALQAPCQEHELCSRHVSE